MNERGSVRGFLRLRRPPQFEYKLGRAILRRATNSIFSISARAESRRGAPCHDVASILNALQVPVGEFQVLLPIVFCHVVFAGPIVVTNRAHDRMIHPGH